ncbi:MAG: hypothetical protein IKS47_05310 [Bacteroidales bacterium]|nr:hypothetical protein [Bacteroidales bacterium]
MKRTAKILFCLTVAAVYILGYMGFGIHFCHDDGSRHLVWMYGDVSCEAIHHHSHEADHDHDHDDGCCTTHVFVLTDAQDSDSGIDRTDAAPDAGIPAIVETPCFAELLPAHLAAHFCDAPPLPEGTSLSLLSVWRV